MSKLFTFSGLFLTLLGSCLLFFYGMPRKKYGNVLITGDSAFKTEPEVGQSDTPDSEWQPIANKFQVRAKILNSTGFGLLAIGTLLQMIAVYF